ncbi:MAG: aryl-sulfate sulfotransferase [Synergistaceae bacterium]|jgi:hypothetical protein|nr:aryl-sulfate sulfotransferase [Synergistaceae bacterium]
MGHPRIYPTGTTYYNADEAYGGYTIFPSAKGALLIDMRGNEVQLWAGLNGFPNKILPGGYVLGSPGARNPRHGFQDHLALLQVDWDGHIVWKFEKNEYIEDPDRAPGYAARQHHDYQREGSPVGYYSPASQPEPCCGNTLILVHEDVSNPRISDKPLLDDRFIEVTWDGEIVWDWRANEHFDELGFDEAARNALFRSPSVVTTGRGDWLHVNSLSTLGPNKWHDSGDERFHPDNIIWDARNANILAITSKATGRVVWRIGPDFRENEPVSRLGWIIGQHHLHMIPRGLPGEGNLLVFDNGGWGGYGAPGGTSKLGQNNMHRDHSRVIEINPVTLEVVWEYTARNAGFSDEFRFYSPYVSSAQRLPNGNTLITEGSDGRIFEVTPEHKTVWEYINPYYSNSLGGTHNMVYRAYRAPYEWIPQLDIPNEEPIASKDIRSYRVPGAASGVVLENETATGGVDPRSLEPAPHAAVNIRTPEQRRGARDFE